jgi:hypothetical protein
MSSGRRPADEWVPRTGAAEVYPGVVMPAAAILDDPALGYPRPDVERHVADQLKALGGVQVWAYASTDGDPPNWLAVVALQVDIRASTKAGAFTRADAARRIVKALPRLPWAEGTCNRADVIDGPFWLPDPQGAPRYVARYRVFCHPKRISERRAS